MKSLLYTTIKQRDVNIVQKLCLDVLIVKIIRTAFFAEEICFGTKTELTNIFQISRMLIPREGVNACLTNAAKAFVRIIIQEDVILYFQH